MSHNQNPVFVEGEEVEILAGPNAGTVGKVVNITYMYQIPVYHVHFPLGTGFETQGFDQEHLKFHQSGIPEMLYVSVRELDHMIKAQHRAVENREKRILNAYTAEAWAEARTMYEIDNATLIALKSVMNLHERNK